MSQTTFTPYAGKPSGFGPTATQDELRLVLTKRAATKLLAALACRLELMEICDEGCTLSIFGTKESPEGVRT